MNTEYPQVITGSVKMSKPNDSIFIKDVTVHLTIENHSVEIEGKLEFQWFPETRVVLNGNLKSGDLLGALAAGHNFTATIQNEKIGCGRVIRSTDHPDGRVSLKVAIDDPTIGDKSVAISKVVFAIPNIRSFHGHPVADANRWAKNRLIFENDIYRIVVDLRMDHRELWKELDSQSGYLILAYGELEKKGSSLSFTETNEVLLAFSSYLSFVTGRRCPCLFREGIHDGETIWTDYNGYPSTPHKRVQSWRLDFSIEGLEEMWQVFYKLWQGDERDKDFLVSAVHWYVESNNHSGLVDGSIIMIQTALELIYNWLLIEKRKLLIADKSTSISASNKIRLLLSELKVSPDFFPYKYADLKRLEVEDAPDALVQIRNALVHSDERKRSKIKNIQSETKAHALHLGIWYVELLLLKILGFNGVYCARGDNQLKRPVPWVNSRE